MTERAMQAARFANPIVLTLAAGFLLGLAVWLLLPWFPPNATSWIGDAAAALRAVLHRDVAPPVTFACLSSETQPPQLPWSLLVTGVPAGTFILGNALGRSRETYRDPGNASNLIFKILIVVLFFAATSALGYETVGTWVTGLYPNSDYKPITSFVRCATSHYQLYAVALASTVSLLIGHWLHRTAS
jgi:hypothetical protein